jgi:RNA polymerase sigma-70 factor (ECF subfamily)
MGQPGSPPDWLALDERVLERQYAGEDSLAAAQALVVLRYRHDQKLHDQAHFECGGDAQLRDKAFETFDQRLKDKRDRYDPGRGRWIWWAKRMLHNVIVDEFRRNAHEVQWSDTIPGSTPTPLEQLEQRELQHEQQQLEQAMKDCLDCLTPEEREALIFQTLDELALKEIGERQGISQQGAGTRVYRAKQKLRECLKRKGYDGGAV